MMGKNDKFRIKLTKDEIVCSCETNGVVNFPHCSIEAIRGRPCGFDHLAVVEEYLEKSNRRAG